MWPFNTKRKAKITQALATAQYEVLTAQELAQTTGIPLAKLHHLLCAMEEAGTLRSRLPPGAPPGQDDRQSRIYTLANR